MEPDFSQLYSQLDLAPDCTVDELKRAYRRRVGQLHPDRHPGFRASETDTEFSELIALYGMAMRFHRRHGRLPGETSVRAQRHAPGAMHDPAAPVRPPLLGWVPPAKELPASNPSSRLAWLGILLIAPAAYVMVSSGMDELPAVEPASSDSGQAMTGKAAISNRPVHLVIGMDMSTVLDIQGTPTHKGATLWEYGPSWILFREGRLVEWYSSPLYRLKVSTPVAVETVPRN